jgi:CRP-like cAMP-binding protein
MLTDLLSKDRLANNRLLATLPRAELERMEHALEPVSIPVGAVLYEPGQTIQHVYFPTTAIISRIYVTEAGNSSAIAMIGNEGMIGAFALMGSKTSPNRAVANTAGFGYRMQAGLLLQEFSKGGPLMHLLLRYVQASLTEIAQTAVCNRRHSVDEQLCKWLLQTLDRLPSNRVSVTQEAIASMIGVRREGITEAAGSLQRAGIIEYCRGQITVMDRAALEERTCECYMVVRNEFDRLMPWQEPTLPRLPRFETPRFATALA